MEKYKNKDGLVAIILTHDTEDVSFTDYFIAKMLVEKPDDYKMKIINHLSIEEHKELINIYGPLDYEDYQELVIIMDNMDAWEIKWLEEGQKYKISFDYGYFMESVELYNEEEWSIA